MFIQIMLTSIIVPKSQDLARSFLRTSTINFFDNFIKPQRFNDTIKGVTIYSGKKDKKGNLYNLYIKKEIADKEFQITYAKKGTFKKLDKMHVLVLHDGQTITGKNEKITNFSFKKSDFPLKNLKTNTTTYKKTQEMSSVDLFKCIYSIYNLNTINTNIENCLQKNLNNILKELHKRFFIPLYVPLLMLIPFLLITSSKENLNYTKIRLITFLIGLFIIIFSETTIRLISETLMNNYFIIVVPIISLFILYLIFLNKFNFIKTK